MARLKIGVLISGRGSNLQALIQSCSRPDSKAAVALVVSNVATAAGLQFARAAGIPTVVIDHKRYADRASFDAAMDAALRAAGVEFVFLAGFMRLLSDGFVEVWRDRMVNIHPSLLPQFKGRHPQRQALDAGARETGCTVHYVRPAMDSGPIIARARVPVLPSDDEATLSARILEAEHRLYPLVMELIAEGQVAVRGEQVVLGERAKRTLNMAEN